MRLKRAASRAAVAIAATAFVMAGPPPSVHGAPLLGAASTGSTSSSSTSGAVTLQGGGTYDVEGEIKDWSNDLYGPTADGAIDVNYTPDGGNKGRADLFSGSNDFAISGVAPTADELKTLKNGAASIIAAPVMPSALGALVLPPTLPNDKPGFAEYNYDANGGTKVVPYTGPIDLTDKSIANMLIASRTDGGAWNDAPNVASFGLPPDVNNDDGSGNQFQPANPPDNTPITYLQSEASEQDYYAQQLAATAAPDDWSNIVTGGKPYTITDQLPPNLDGVRTAQGVPTTYPFLAPINTATYGDTSGLGGGIFAAEPPSALVGLKAANTSSTTAKLIQWVAAENDKGQYVTPSPKSIDAAINAGGATPFYGMTHSTDGAYPFTYVDDIYVPSSGLSVDKTEAIATMIRYLATDGQQYDAANNDGILSTDLVSQALAAANQVVSSNCKAAGGTVVTNSDPGRLAPDSKGMKQIGSMLHCNGSGVNGTGGSGSGVGSSALADSGGFTPLASDELATSGNEATAPGSSLAAGGAGAKARAAGLTRKLRADKSQLGAISLPELPLKLPWSGVPAYDRLGALLLGAGCFFAGRRVVRWLVRLCQG